MVGLVVGALAVGDKEGASVLPEEGPDLFAISAGEWEGFEVFVGGKMERAFLVFWRQRGEAWLDFKQEHQPMSVALIAVFADDAGEVEVVGRELQSGFFVGFTDGTGVRAFSIFGFELAAWRTIAAAVGLMIALDQQHAPILVKGVQQRGNPVWQRHTSVKQWAGWFPSHFFAAVDFFDRRP